MEYRTELGFKIEEKTAVSIGKFDGLHLGHQKLLEKIKNQKAAGLASVVFTFQASPGALLEGHEVKALLTRAERKKRLEEEGVDYLIELPFTEEISRMKPEAFVRDILIGQFQMSYLAVGTDFRFGYQKKGTPELLKELSGKYQFEIEIVAKRQHDGQDISSTLIKRAIEKGEMEKAEKLLGYPYTISGQVLHGNKIGRTLGMPTANIMSEKEKILPPNGVYATRTMVNGRGYPGITNIGYKPTVGGEKRRGVETYIFDFDDDIYGSMIEVALYTYERPEKKFESLLDLKHQVEQDILFGRTYFKESTRKYQ